VTEPDVTSPPAEIEFSLLVAVRLCWLSRVAVVLNELVVSFSPPRCVPSSSDATGWPNESGADGSAASDVRPASIASAESLAVSKRTRPDSPILFMIASWRADVSIVGRPVRIGGVQGRRSVGSLGVTALLAAAGAVQVDRADDAERDRLLVQR